MTPAATPSTLGPESSTRPAEVSTGRRAARRPVVLGRGLSQLLADGLGRFLGVTEASIEDPCPTCLRACENVVPGAYACRGPIFEGQCDACVGVVEVAGDVEKRCLVSPHHIVTNVRQITQ